MTVANDGRSDQLQDTLASLALFADLTGAELEARMGAVRGILSDAGIAASSSDQTVVDIVKHTKETYDETIRRGPSGRAARGAPKGGSDATADSSGARRSGGTAVEASGGEVLLGRESLRVLPAPARLGALQADLDHVNRSILSGKTELRAERRALLDEIAKVKEQAAQYHRNQSRLLEAKMAMRENELMLIDNEPTFGVVEMGRTATIDRAAIDQEFAALHRAISESNINYYKAQLAGTRWRLEHAPTGPVMRLVDDLGVRVSEKERTMLGRVWDTLFGALPNKRLAFEADRVIYEAAGKAGVTPEKVERFKYELHKIVEDNTHQYPGGFQRSKYVSIFTIEPSTINKVAQRVGMGEAPAGFKSWSEVVFRAYPGPMKIAQQQVLGKSLAIPYSERYHYLTRTMYPMLRFYFSPRFLLMNLTERSILGYAKGGPDYFKEADPRLRRLADGLRKADTRMENTAYVDVGDHPGQVARLAMAMRRDEVAQAITAFMQKDSVMQQALRDAGVNVKSTESIARYLDDVMKQRSELIKLDRPVGAEEQKLAARIKGLRDTVDEMNAGEEVLAREKLAKLEDELTKMQVDRVVREEAARLGGVTPQPLLDAVSRAEHELVSHARRIFIGNPDRSVMERVLNSYLLYWPISYQLKTGRVMAEVMFSRGIGLPTGSAPAVAWSRMYHEHQRKLESDAQYRSFFERNKQTLFLLQQLMPMSPDSVGVTLSGFTRAGGALFGLGSNPDVVKRLEQVSALGPIYDYQLGLRIVREQTKEGGLLAPLIDRE